MSKIYFVMNNRENTSEGYKEVSEEEFRNYIENFPEGERAYFINLGYAVMETSEENYRDYYKDVDRNNYLKKLDVKNGLMSYTALDTEEFNGADIVEDTSEPFEDKVLRRLMIEKMPDAFEFLTAEEQELICQIYFEGISENVLSGIYGVNQSTITRRKQKILLKLKNYFEN